MGIEINSEKNSNKKKLLEFIRDISKTVITTALERNKDDKIRWIDMKFNPVNGENIYNRNKWYSKRMIYSWIQGRALETICEYLKFMEENEVDLCSRDELLKVGDSIYKNLFPLVSDWSKGNKSVSIPFVFDCDLKQSGEDENVFPTISDMFVFRGLALYASVRQKKNDINFLVQNLRYISKIAVNGNLINDQIDYNTGKFAFTPKNSIGLEGNMLAIGASSILYRITDDKKDLEIGYNAIYDTITRHGFKNENGKLFVVDYVKDGNVIFNKDGNLENNPGHTLEICGMGLQFLRENSKFLVSKKNFNEIKETLINLAVYHFTNGLTPVGTVYLGIDINKKKPIKPISPWWSSFESLRTLSEVYFSNRDTKILELILNLKSNLIKTYLTKSKTKVPIQTVDDNGNIIETIPATADLDPGYHTSIPLFDVYQLFSCFYAGFSTVNIVLENGVRLQGHAARLGLAEKIHDPLSIHTVILNSGLKRTALVVCDLVELGQNIVDEITAEVNITYGIEKDCFLISTVHTHTGPASMKLGDMSPSETFRNNLKTAVLKSINIALNNFEEVEVGISQNEVDSIGVNRRFFENGKIVMKPNFEGDIDKTVVTVAFYNRKNILKGLMLQVSLHPTTLGVDIHKYSADYLGGLYKEISERYGVDVVVMQGACGDVRPCILGKDGKNFTDGDFEDCRRIGKAIADKVEESIKSINIQKLNKINNIYFVKEKIKLPVEIESLVSVNKTLATAKYELNHIDEITKDMDPFTKAHDSTAMLLKDDISWCEEMIEKYHNNSVNNHIEADIAFMSLDNLIGIAFLPGEAFTSIGKEIKRILKQNHVIICGYYSGSVGYIPNKKAFTEGGYEVNQAFRSYRFPGPFKPDVGNQIVSKIVEMDSKLEAIK